jgi:hypothetical protein
MVEVGDREVEVEGEPLREKRPVLVTEADGLLVGEIREVMEYIPTLELVILVMLGLMQA